MSLVFGADAAGGFPGGSWGEFGLIGLIIAALMVFGYRFVEMWFKASVEREAQQRAILEKVSIALNELTAIVKGSQLAAERELAAIHDLAAAIGRLPCTQTPAPPAPCMPSGSETTRIRSNTRIVA